MWIKANKTYEDCMFWNNFSFNFYRLYFFSNDQIWRKTNYGEKTCSFTMILCQVSVQSKILQSCEPLKREVYNGSIDKPLSRAGQVGVSIILLNKKLVITTLNRRGEYRGNEGFSSMWYFWHNLCWKFSRVCWAITTTHFSSNKILMIQVFFARLLEKKF